MRRLSRRRVLTLGGLVTGGLALRGLVPGPRALAGTGPGHRRILMVFVSGGWDLAYTLAPPGDNPVISGDPTGQEATVGGFPLVDAASRPSVRGFFEQHGEHLCLVHGMEVRSIAHDNCRRITFTGGTNPDADDWGAVLGSVAGELPLPHAVVEGPSYTWRLGQFAARLGSRGQLAGLLDGTALDAPQDPAVSQAVDAWLATTLDGRSADPLAASYAGSLSRARDLAARGVDVTTAPTFRDQVDTALNLLHEDLSRSLLITHTGAGGLLWDTHANNHLQDLHWEDLFGSLQALIDGLQTTDGPAGGSLWDETTVAVFSEMSRHPVLNALDGKDHWTHTSALLLGAGVQGGQILGGYDDSVFGLPVDLASGAVDTQGTRLVAAHLGATLLSLGGVDPAPFVPGIDPIAAVWGGG